MLEALETMVEEAFASRLRLFENALAKIPKDVVCLIAYLVKTLKANSLSAFQFMDLLQVSRLELS